MAKTRKESICLVIPPSGFLLDERVFMTLGILKVAAVLESSGVRVEMVDLSGIKNFEEVMGVHARNSSSKLFGLTATTPQMPYTSKINRVIRSIRPDAVTILGGPHVTLVNAAYKKELKRCYNGRATRAMKVLMDSFDQLVAGDGEDAIFVAMKNRNMKLVDADDPKSVLFLDNERLTEYPFPARHLVDIGSYKYHIDGKRALSLIAQLGCPFACGFCGGRSSPFLRRVRMRTSENIVSEMVELYEFYGIEGFMLYDDELNVNPNMVELMRQIREAQDQLGVEWRLRGFIKSQLFTDEQARVMYEAGFRWILVGFESGSPRILENINKRATRDENTRCMEFAKKHNLRVKALMSIGHPGENEDTIMDTRDWLLEVEPDDFDVTIITTYPGTPYYDESVPHPIKDNTWVYTYEKTGDKLYSYEIDYTEVSDYYKGDPNEGYKSFVYTDHLSPEELVKLRNFTENDARKRLNIPFNPSAAAINYEHSMGQNLPGNILKVTDGRYEDSVKHKK